MESKYNFLNNNLPFCAEDGKSHRQFTLVELLAVIGLMGLLMALMVPALDNIATGRSVDGAIREVTAALRQARQYAIANRKKTAVVFPGDNYDGSDADDYKFRAFAAFFYDESDDEYVLIPGSKWQKLGTGAVVDTKDGDSDVSDINSKGTSDASDGLNAVVFKSTGALDHSDATLVIKQGTYNEGDSPTITNEDNQLKITVNQFTGRTQVEE